VALIVAMVECGGMAEACVAGRRSFEQRAWRDAYDKLSAADRRTPLGLDDLELLAMSAYLVGEDRDGDVATERAHHECLRVGDVPRAARCAFWLGFGLLMRGEMAPAGGWFARAGRLLDDGGLDCVERGFLLLPVALGHLFSGDTGDALAEFTAALAIGERFADVDLAAIGRLGRGQALVLGGEQANGVAELDEVMVSVTAGEVSPMVAGMVYCAVIEMCQLTFDVRRAHEWTDALTRWCDAQPDLVPYRGQCLVHRAEILQFHGAWPQAMGEAERACEQLSRPPGHPAVGEALYRLGELLRLQGEFTRAEQAYRRASEMGRDPQPGLARLRLAQGQSAVAASSIRRAVEEAVDRVMRAQLLAAYVELVLAVEDIAAARMAADELVGLATAFDAPVLEATAGHATALVLLAEGDARAALGVLRPAWVAWRDLEAPYEAARVRVALGVACRQLGDADGASMELAAAAGAFRTLGAVVDLASLEQPATPPPARHEAAGLSAREQQVLALVATGMTNRAIAAELVISDKTVARHIANMFTKLGVTSRSAATAYAYEHGLVGQGYTQ
jgi:DNA-binding CsgD family transcriptional regulator